MADALKDWKSTIIWAVGLVFICGMTYNTVTGMDKRVTVNTSDIKGNKDAIHSNELLFTGLKTTVDSTKEDTKELRKDFKELKNYLMQYDFDKKEP